MKLELYAIKDVKIGFMNPLPLNNRAVAIREFSTAVAARQGVFEKYPEDMEFWKIGTYDNETGLIEADLVFVCAARDFMGDNSDE